MPGALPRPGGYPPGTRESVERCVVSWPALTARLRAVGVKLRDVHTVIVTHSHPSTSAEPVASSVKRARSSSPTARS
jgi:hypothetical protein